MKRILIEYDAETGFMAFTDESDDADLNTVEIQGLMTMALFMVQQGYYRDGLSGGDAPAPPHYTYEEEKDSKPKRWDWRNKG